MQSRKTQVRIVTFADLPPPASSNKAQGRYFIKLITPLAYLDLQRIDFSSKISEVLSKSRNRIMLHSDMLLINSLGEEIKKDIGK